MSDDPSEKTKRDSVVLWDQLTEEEKKSGKWVLISRKQRRAAEAIKRRLEKKANRK